jgi:hypothetical protein
MSEAKVYTFAANHFKIRILHGNGTKIVPLPLVASSINEALNDVRDFMIGSSDHILTSESYEGFACKDFTVVVSASRKEEFTMLDSGL